VVYQLKFRSIRIKLIDQINRKDYYFMPTRRTSTRRTASTRSRSSSTKRGPGSTGRKRRADGTFASTGSSKARKAGFPSTPHKRTSSGRKLFEPIDKTPRERLQAGEKLPHYISKTGQRWTRDDVKELRTLAKKNTPTRVISSKIGRSPDAIQAKASQEHISLKPANRSPYGRRS
jgi:hypothetical protein